jgi:hypothetical protein
MWSRSIRALPPRSPSGPAEFIPDGDPCAIFRCVFSRLHHPRREWFIPKPSRILKLGKLTKEESAKSFHEDGGDGLTSSAVDPLCRESSLSLCLVPLKTARVLPF